ncbi:rubrerythrin [Symbiobacterium thermophilum]|uniref:Rubrerythrin n=2 Tax=Symbiobacterium thermophilum TaxID=2734 RepID=Q67LY2_SYMTH|nr:rubrerythrin family protein [Symbiobacterium thermophilum]MBY6278083.1 rubrerythrin family protein [Symbiobacterium thermophilum]BAD41314.1 rubrerythrin [Symbiobacterium thermophilum IAM 14863]
MNLKGTRTLENLLKAFAGESQAQARYMMYAKVARDEGLEQIAAIFEETALNEAEHGKRFFSLAAAGLEGEMPADVEIQAAYPIAIGNTVENLKAAAAGEHHEWAEMYPEFADIAEAEGFKEIATAFRMIAKAETAHETRYRKLVENLEKGVVFQRDGKYFWKCRNCGYIHEGTAAPKFCPACQYPQAYFEIFVENY